MSPEKIMALRAALQAIPGMCSYYWQKIFCDRGHPSVHIIVCLGYGFEHDDAAEVAIEMLKRDMEGIFVNMTVIVTHSEKSFWTLRASAMRDLK
jgi:hypothetical protein